MTEQHLDPLLVLITQHHYRRKIRSLIDELSHHGLDTRDLEVIVERSRWESSNLIDQLPELSDLVPLAAEMSPPNYERQRERRQANDGAFHAAPDRQQGDRGDDGEGDLQGQLLSKN